MAISNGSPVGSLSNRLSGSGSRLARKTDKKVERGTDVSERVQRVLDTASDRVILEWQILIIELKFLAIPPVLLINWGRGGRKSALLRPLGGGSYVFPFISLHLLQPGALLL